MILKFEEVIKQTSNNKDDIIARGLPAYVFLISGHLILYRINLNTLEI